jgi:hypothetical protein
MRNNVGLKEHRIMALYDKSRVNMKNMRRWIVTILLCVFAVATIDGAQGEKKPGAAIS